MKVDFVNLGLQYSELKDEIIEIFNEISSSGSYVLGEQVEKFEEKFANYCGTKYAIGIGNGSDESLAIGRRWLVSPYLPIPQRP